MIWDDGNFWGLGLEPRIGSTFTVTLWLLIGETEAEVTKNLIGESIDQIPLPISYQDTRVLLVEDQPLNREIVEVLLADLGIAVDVMVNGRDAVERLIERGSGGYDLVLMDVQMPVMDGLSATRVIRCKPEFDALPIIGMTAHTMEHEKKIGAEAGMNGHIGKPFDHPALFRMLARWIPQHKQITDHPASTTGTVGLTSCASQGLHSLNGLDTVGALARLGGKDDRYRFWLADFVNNASQVQEEISRELDSDRTEIAAKLLHSFKGRVGTLGMTDVHAAVTALEESLKAGKQIDEELNFLASQISRMRERLIVALDLESASADNNQHAVNIEHIAWNAAFSVGDQQLDAQHRKLISIINQLADCYSLWCASESKIGQIEARKAFHQALTAMFDYTQTHFTAEEAHMRKIGFAWIDEHQSEHASFIEKLGEFSLLAAEGEGDMQEVHRYLKTWLFNHILKSDMQYHLAEQ